MKHITILALNNCQGASIVGPMEIFQKVNDYFLLHDLERYPFFKIEVVGLHKEPIRVGPNLSIHCNRTLEEVEQTDLILIPAIDERQIEAAIANNTAFINWIHDQYSYRRTEVASICVGAFVLAATGLMDGLPCSTHWAAAPQFQRMFPKVNLQAEHILTDHKGIYTTGGALSYQYLGLYLIEKFAGRAAALWASKMFLIDMDHTSQLWFSTTPFLHDHKDLRILQAQRFIEAHFCENLKVEDIAEEVALSKRSFIRRFKKATHQTPIQYIQSVKIEAAKEALELTEQTVNEIMYEVGYSDIKSFRSLFKKFTGLSPIDYRKKFAGFRERMLA